MYRPSSSYFVSITGDEAIVTAAASEMVARSICPDYLSLSTTGVGLREYEVAEGAMDRWDDVEEVFAALAKDFPALTIEVLENCEELVFPAREMLFHGENTKIRYGRILAPDEYDIKTCQAIAELLRSKGMDEAANLALPLADAREAW